MATAGGAATTTAALARAVPLVGGPVNGTSTANGTTSTARGLVGSSTGLSTASAAVRVALTLAGRADGLSTADSFDLTLIRGLVGSSDGLSTADAFLILIALTYGQWNGEFFETMQYGDKQVVDWILTPP